MKDAKERYGTEFIKVVEKAVILQMNTKED